MGCPYSKADRLPRITWETVHRTGKTGDILLFGGQSMWALAEECVTATPYSHVAILFRHPKTNRLFVAESSGVDGLKDFFTKKDKPGPRLVDAKRKILEYSQKYGWGVSLRRLKGEAVREMRNNKKTMYELLYWFEKQSPKHFEMHKFEMAESYLHHTLFNRAQDSCSWFCSEYVAGAWQKMGIRMNDRPDQYCPQDYTENEEDVFEESFNNPQGAYLGPELLIVSSKTTTTLKKRNL